MQTMRAWGCLLPALLAFASVSALTARKEVKSFWFDSAQQTLRNAIKQRPNLKVAKNVIMFLGDGMGVSTVTAARIYKGQLDGGSGEETQLSFEKFPSVALSKTYNTDRQTPDSAGTATAFLCGVKANMGTLGVDNRIERSNCSLINDTDTHTSSILAWSLNAGKAVGIVTTTRVTHATPAASYAHIPDRDWETDHDIPPTCRGLKDIAYQLLIDNPNIQVILGGGRREFYNRNDTRNLIQEWLAEKQRRRVSAEYVQDAAGFRAVTPANTDYLLGLFTESHMAYELERNNNTEPALWEMTRKAIEILKKDDDGFFLLVEGGRIDHGHHDNFAKKALQDTVAFDAAVTVAKAMTGDDTLIVVTADHSHVFNIAGYPTRGNNILGLVDDVVPDQFPLDNLTYTTLVYANGPGPGREENASAVNTTADNYRFQRLVPMREEWETHAGEDVAIYATGPMSHLFHGVHEQNYIAHVMGYAACVGPNTEHCDNPADEYTCTGATGRLGVTSRFYYGVVFVVVKILNLLLMYELS